ncbi:MAG: NAD(P)/FAD-dependent oxidoreductase [Alphaproteobacteria bacterium]
MKTFDTIIIGAGAAGLMAAIQLTQRKKSILILDMGDNPARKVAISGGGNCNFTNMRADYTHYFGKNPRFVMSALSQFSPRDTLNWVKSHDIEYVEKEPGRYFCKNGANEIVNGLLCDIGNTPIKYNTNVIDLEKTGDIFVMKTDNGVFNALSVIVATGGVSYPHLGVSDIGQKIAKKFGHKIEPVRPALCAIKTKSFGTDLAGISLPVEITVGKQKIADNLLFTHFGIGGPAVYRATVINSKEMVINFAPEIDAFETLKNLKQKNGKKSVSNIIATILPNKLAHFLCDDTRNIADIRDSELKQIANTINHFEINDGTAIGFQSAEVMIGGISTDKISSKTMESVLCAKLYFVGEVLDVAGDLGGFNIQWAFSSGFVAGNNA